MIAIKKEHVLLTVFVSVSFILNPSYAATQPKVALCSDEPHWADLLEKQWGLDMDRDLRNPLCDQGPPVALFQRADVKKPVVFTPIIALGVEQTTRGGWYEAGPRASVLPANPTKAKHELWSYAYKQPEPERKQSDGRFTLPPLQSGDVKFEPGDQPFGLWISNDSFNDGGVYTQPALVAKINDRLKAQPYKAMIYPHRDLKTGKLVPNSYIIGWEYSTNDDFQDVVTRIENVKLLPTDLPLKTILAPEAKVQKLADGFKFVEGPTWDPQNNVLYFSDIPRAQIIRYADGQVAVVKENSGRANGLMLDKKGMLVACEGGGEGGKRRISRALPGQAAEDVATSYNGKRINSPNDLWLDAAGGVYFTDPRYGGREDMELDVEAVYYVSAQGEVVRLIDDLVRPNGIALAPDGKFLYVVDNGADELHRYPLTAPGKIGPGRRIAYVAHPDGMAVDVLGRLYIADKSDIQIFDAEGKWLGRIETPEQPSNCKFGGPDNRTLFITARTSLYAIETLTRGWHVHLDGIPGK